MKSEDGDEVTEGLRPWFTTPTDNSLVLFVEDGGRGNKVTYTFQTHRLTQSPST